MQGDLLFGFELAFRLSDEIDELKNLPVRDADEEIFELRERYEQLHAEWKIGRSEHDALQRDIDHKQSLIQRHEFEMQKQVETVAYLNNEVRFAEYTVQLLPPDIVRAPRVCTCCIPIKTSTTKNEAYDIPFHTGVF